MQEIVSGSPSLMGSSTPIEKEAQIEPSAPSYYYGQNEFYYQNPAVAAAVLHQHYHYSNSAFSVNSLVENSNADQSTLVNQLQKPILNPNWQSSPNMSKNSSPNTNPTNTSSSSDSDYFNPYQEQDKVIFNNDVSSSNDFVKYQQQNIFQNSRNFASQGTLSHSNFYSYDQYQRQYASMAYYSSPKYEDMDAKNSKIVSSSPKIDQLGNQVLCSSSSSSFTSSPNSNKNTSTPTTASSQNVNISSTSPPNAAAPDSFDWMKPVKSAPNGKS